MQNEGTTPLAVYIQFDLPFVIFVKDSARDLELEAWAEAYTNNQPLPYAQYAPSSQSPSFTIIGGEIPLYNPDLDNLAEPYVILSNGLYSKISFLKRINPHSTTHIACEMPGDRTGKASFSSVIIEIPLSQIKPEYQEDHPILVDAAIEAINHFIEHYRVWANRPYISTVTPAVIQRFHLTTIYNDNTPHKLQYSTSNGAAHGFGGAISEEVDIKIRESVSKNEPPPLSDVLETNILDHLDLQEWRLALIESAVLFESWLHRYLKDKYKSAKLQDADIEKKFLRNDGIPHSVTYLAKNLVKDATGFDFGSTFEFTNWASKVRDYRNDIVHGSKYIITPQEALEAYTSVKQAIELLSTK